MGDYPDATTVPGLVVFRYDSPLFFANAMDFRVRALSAVDDATASGPPTRWLLINAEAIVDVDITAVDALDELLLSLQRRRVVLAFARVKYEVLTDLDRVGFVDRVGRDRFFATLPVALDAYAQWDAEHPGTTAAS